MKTVSQLVDELSSYPPGSPVAACFGQDCGIVVFPAGYVRVLPADGLPEEIGNPIGFVVVTYVDPECAVPGVAQ